MDLWTDCLTTALVIDATPYRHRYDVRLRFKQFFGAKERYSGPLYSRMRLKHRPPSPIDSVFLPLNYDCAFDRRCDPHLSTGHSSFFGGCMLVAAERFEALRIRENETLTAAR